MIDGRWVVGAIGAVGAVKGLGGVELKVESRV